MISSHLAAPLAVATVAVASHDIEAGDAGDRHRLAGLFRRLRQQDRRARIREVAAHHGLPEPLLRHAAVVGRQQLAPNILHCLRERRVRDHSGLWSSSAHVGANSYHPTYPRSRVPTIIFLWDLNLGPPRARRFSMQNDKDAAYLSSCDVARLAGVTAEAVRYWERKGQLRCIRTAGGTRLFTREDVEALLRTRGDRKRLPYQRNSGSVEGK